MNELNDIFAKVRVIDPTSQNNSPWIEVVSRTYAYLSDLVSIPLDDLTKQTKEVVFSYPAFLFTKPERKSRKTGAMKAAGSYYAVFDPQQLGAGSYGGVYPVLGVWKHVADSQWVFKTKGLHSDPRLVKTNALKKFMTADELEKIYCEEQQFGKYVKHMGLDYKPVRHEEYTFLLMRKLEGASLGSVIDKLKVNPNYLSVRDRLKITVNLLKELVIQVTGVQIPVPESDALDYLVHCDIKPDNVILGPDLSVTFIDYGLSRPSSKTKRGFGTVLYMDPLVFDGHKQKPDGESDFYSTARVISELWGELSGDKLNTHHELSHRNRNNILTGLLEGISGLTNPEQLIIPQLVLDMTRYEEKERISREGALVQFEQLLRNRKVMEELKLKNLVEHTPIKELTADELLFILNSDRAVEFIKRSEPGSFSTILDDLKQRLFELDENVLHVLKQHLNYDQAWLMFQFIVQFDITADVIKKSIHLGVPVDERSLAFWINNVPADGDQLKWVSICRLLYNVTKNADQILNAMDETDSFKYIYCHRFLKNKDASSDDQLNLRLIKKHLELTRKGSKFIESVKKWLALYFPLTPLATTLTSVLEQYQTYARNHVITVEPPVLRVLHSKLDEFNRKNREMRSLIVLDTMKNRTTRIEALNAAASNPHHFSDEDSTLVHIERIISEWVLLSELEFSFQKLKVKLPPHLLNVYIEQIDEYYDSESNRSEQLLKDTSDFCSSLDTLDLIYAIRKDMTKSGLSFSADSILEKSFKEAMKWPRLAESQDFRIRLLSYSDALANCIYLWSYLKNRRTNLFELTKVVNESLYMIHRSLCTVLPEEQVALIMNEIHIGLKIPNEPLYPSNQSGAGFFSKKTGEARINPGSLSLSF